MPRIRVHNKTPSAPRKVAVERTLDPENWESFRTLAHRVLDDAIDYVRDVRHRKPWQPLPDFAKASLSADLPETGQPLEQVYREFRQNVMPYPLGNIHPRHWGWVNGTGTPEGLLSELLVATMNSNVTGHDQAPVWVELQVIDWFKKIFRFPAAAGGLVVSGCSMANLTGLLAARTYVAGSHVRDRGLTGKGAPKFTVYGSSEGHYCIPRALDVMGLGRHAYRAVRTRPDFTVDTEALRLQIAQDRKAGFQPLAIVGNAGTVNTGALDPLAALATIAEREGLWFHVDGAFGAAVCVSERLRSRLKGIARADSIAFDLHKWLYQPYGAGCVLVRNADNLRRAFAFDAPYFRPLEGGTSRAVTKFNDLGVEHSRRFRALSIWFSLKTRGVKTFARLIEQNVSQAEWLGRRLQHSKTLELMAPVALNVVVFRFNPGGLTPDQLNLVNHRLLIEIQNRGIAVPSSTHLNGAFGLRLAVVNHRSRLDDFELMAASAETLGAELLHKMSKPA